MAYICTRLALSLNALHIFEAFLAYPLLENRQFQSLKEKQSKTLMRVYIHI